MSEIGVADGRATWRDTPSAGGHALDARRALQLALAGLWLVDALLQYQPGHVQQGVRPVARRDSRR